MVNLKNNLKIDLATTRHMDEEVTWWTIEGDVIEMFLLV